MLKKSKYVISKKVIESHSICMSKKSNVMYGLEIEPGSESAVTTCWFVVRAVLSTVPPIKLC